MSTHRRDSFRTFLHSRRTAVTAGSLGLAAALGLPSRSGAAQQEDLPQVVADFVTAWETLDPEQIADHYVKDAVAEVVAPGTVVVGRDSVRGYLVEFIGAFSDATAEIPTTSAIESQAAMEWVFEGRCTGELPGSPPRMGQAMRLHGCSLVEFSEDVIQRTVGSYDVYGVLVQLGVVPLPPGATPAG